MKPQIGFFYDRKARMELVLCRRSELSYPLHNHVSVFTLGMVLDGALKVTIGSGAQSCGQGEVFLIPPYVPHSIQAQGRYSMLSLCVHKDRAAQGGAGGMRGDGAGLLRACGPDLEMACGRLLDLLDCLPVLARTVPADGTSPVGRMRRVLELHPEDRLSVEEMAASAFISKYDFIRAFKREVGLTPHQFQLQNRVRKAQRLLAGAGSVAETALEAGFCDQSHLIKQFKRITGLTPADYRAACSYSAPWITRGRG